MHHGRKLLALSVVFVSAIILLGANAGQSGGCNPPEITVDRPSSGENIPNAPVSLKFSAKQGLWDLSPIDPASLQVQLLDNLNTLIDVTQFIATNCDLLKKNCTYTGDVSIPDGTYKLTVKVCNQAAACSTKEVVFDLGNGVWAPDLGEWWNSIQDDIRDFMEQWRKISSGCYYHMLPQYIRYRGCIAAIDPDCDNIRSDQGYGKCDNCPTVSNPDQSDANGNGVGDACDSSDSDGDGLADSFEYRIGTKRNDSDSDDDGVLDSDEVRFGSNPLKADTNGDGKSDFEQLDKNGTLIKGQQIPDGYQPKDTDGDGLPDASDPDPLNPQTIGEIKYPMWLVSSNWDIHTIYKLAANSAPAADYYIFDSDVNIHGKYGLILRDQFWSLSSAIGCGPGKGGGGGNFMRTINATSGDSLEVNGPDVKCKAPKEQNGAQRNCDGGSGVEVPTNEWRCDGVQLDGAVGYIPCEYYALSVDEGSGLQKAVVRFHEQTTVPGSFEGHSVIDMHSTTTLIQSCSPCCQDWRLESPFTIDDWRLGIPVFAYVYDDPSKPSAPLGYQATYSYELPRYLFERGEPFPVALHYSARDYIFNPPPNDKLHAINVKKASLDYTPVKIINPPGEKEPTKNKYVYNDSTDEPKMSIDVEALVPNDSDIRAFIGPLLKWDIDPINGSGKKWKNKPLNGVGITDTVTFTNLPVDNAQFGPKNITLEMVSGVNSLLLDTIEVKTFFRKQEKNHKVPGLLGAPNWFAFWPQVADIIALALPQIQYQETILDVSTGRLVAGFYPRGENYFLVSKLAAEHYEMLTEITDSIDTFGAISVHEKCHLDYWIKTWGLGEAGYTARKEKEDKDGDLLKDSDEANGIVQGIGGAELSPNYKNTNWGTESWMNDFEDYCIAMQQEGWGITQADGDDWSYPGKQWQ